MKLKYSTLITFLLVWAAVALLRVTAERDQLQEQLGAIEGVQTATIESPSAEDANPNMRDTRAALASTDEGTSRTTSGWTASEWADRIKAIAPETITLTEIVATDDYVTLTGEANSSSDIAMLMRAIDAAELGSPNLQQAMRIGDVSEFTLGVKVKQAPSMLTPAY